MFCMYLKKLDINIGNIEWLETENLANYEDCVKFMEKRAIGIRQNNEQECVWLVQHTPLYTGGTSALQQDLLSNEFPVYESGRGGQYTYHGPGQRTVYVMLDLEKRGLGIKEFIYNLEQWIINTLADFDVIGERRDGRVGIWVANKDNSEDKICAIGVRIKKWVSYHGIAFNINPDLSHYKGIVPCGISDNNLSVTSLEKLGINATMQDFDDALIRNFKKIF